MEQSYGRIASAMGELQLLVQNLNTFNEGLKVNKNLMCYDDNLLRNNLITLNMDSKL